MTKNSACKLQKWNETKWKINICIEYTITIMLDGSLSFWFISSEIFTWFHKEKTLNSLIRQIDIINAKVHAPDQTRMIMTIIYVYICWSGNMWNSILQLLSVLTRNSNSTTKRKESARRRINIIERLMNYPEFLVIYIILPDRPDNSKKTNYRSRCMKIFACSGHRVRVMLNSICYTTLVK